MALLRSARVGSIRIDFRRLISSKKEDACRSDFSLSEEDDLQKAYEMDSQESVELKTFEIAFDRTCQLACSYCNSSCPWLNGTGSMGRSAQCGSMGLSLCKDIACKMKISAQNLTNAQNSKILAWA